eukprot:765649-Hanusia_phi.AAC.4
MKRGTRPPPPRPSWPPQVVADGLLQPAPVRLPGREVELGQDLGRVHVALPLRIPGRVEHRHAPAPHLRAQGGAVPRLHQPQQVHHDRPLLPAHAEEGVDHRVAVPEGGQARLGDAHRQRRGQERAERVRDGVLDVGRAGVADVDEHLPQGLALEEAAVVAVQQGHELVVAGEARGMEAPGHAPGLRHKGSGLP